MKKLLLVTCAMLLGMVTLSQTNLKDVDVSLVKINPNLYASKYEVSNKLYMSFLNALKQANKTNLLAIAQIDTLNWRNVLNYNEPYVHYYHAHPAYQNYPVVNISFDAAKLFCEWLTTQYNADPKRKFNKIAFRLPTEHEWVVAAKSGDSTTIYPWHGNTPFNKKNQAMCNFIQELSDSNKTNYNADVLAPVNSYWKNKYGLYNMSGNAAEMVSEKGVTKGGSWKDKSEYLKIDTHNKYDGNAHAYVGFRYFAEIIEK